MIPWKIHVTPSNLIVLETLQLPEVNGLGSSHPATPSSHSEMEQLLGSLARYGSGSRAGGEPAKTELYETIISTALGTGGSNGSLISRAFENQKGAVLRVLVNGEYEHVGRLLCAASFGSWWWWGRNRREVYIVLEPMQIRNSAFKTKPGTSVAQAAQTRKVIHAAHSNKTYALPP